MNRLSAGMFLIFTGTVAGCTTFLPQPPAPVPVEDRALPGTQTREDTAVIKEIITPRVTPAELEPAGKDTPEPTVVEQPPPGPAVVALLNDADQYSAAGRREQAVASLERALRIEPGNPVLWHRLSRLRLQQGQWDQAIALAKKSNALTRGNEELQANNWEVIAEARAAMGDVTGALQARKMAHGLRH
jgi:hypothetical protein